MSKQDGAHLTSIQHLLMAATKLRAVHARLLQYGEAASEDPGAIDRVEISLQHIEKARHTLSAAEVPAEVTAEDIPF